MTIRLATRGSALALRQAAGVRAALETRRRPVELVEVETRGDELRDELITRLGKTGAFVRALDERVLDGDCDAAVHSMKDVPTDFPDDLVVAGVPERGPARDVLVTPDGTGLDDLPDGAVVGTSSLRRRAQLLAERPDLTVEPLRGNVDTRVEKLLAPSLQREHERRDEDDSDASTQEWFDGLSEIERTALGREWETEYDAIVLAEAGLSRLGLLHHVEYERLDPGRFVPATGQGAIAVTARADGDVAETVYSRVDHPPTRVATTVERVVLRELGAGCIAPVGIYARLQGEFVNCVVRVLDRDGEEEVKLVRDLPVNKHREAARDLAADLRERGATDLIEAARLQDDERENRPAAHEE